MPRAKTGIVRRRRHQRILKRAKGYWGLRSKSFRIAQQTLLNAEDYAYRDRRDKKADFRRLWIARINAAARQEATERSEEHTSELQSRPHLVCRLLLEKKKKKKKNTHNT